MTDSTPLVEADISADRRAELVAMLNRHKVRPTELQTILSEMLANVTKDAAIAPTQEPEQ